MNRRMLTYGVVATLALGAMPVLAQTTDFSGTISVQGDEVMSDSAEYQRYLELATVSLPEAIEAAQTSLAGTALPAEAELDEERGYLVWEVTIDRQAVVVDAGSGEILATVPEDTDEDPTQAQVSLLDAVAMAQAELGHDNFPSSVSLDDEDGTLVWEVEFGEQDVVVDAMTGTILRADSDDDDENDD